MILFFEKTSFEFFLLKLCGIEIKISLQVLSFHTKINESSRKILVH